MAFLPSFDIDAHHRWDGFKIPKPIEQDYGKRWPSDTPQLVKELKLFLAATEKRQIPGGKSAFNHFLKILQLLFPHIIEFKKDVTKGGIYLGDGKIMNNYCLDIAYRLTMSPKRRVALAGPASANKTYITAAWGYVLYVSSPKDTSVLISTTSGSASERRIWGDIKDFHREAKFLECHVPKVGEVIEYLKCITFDEGKQLAGSDKNDRDYRNGVIVIPIATDSTGEAAMTTIQGTKNKHVYWILDEGAQMQDGVTRPTRNLATNPYYKFVIIGNSSSPNDPHGQECMPAEGIDALSIDRDRNWVSSKGTDVLFLHGEESPNYHPLIDLSKVTSKDQLPYPYASNHIDAEEIALDCGNGDIVSGKETLDYYKFCLGFWAPSEASSSLFSSNLFKSHNANLPAEILTVARRTFAGGDFAFTAGGDDNSYYKIEFGLNAMGQKRLNFSKETKSIKVRGKDKGEFIEATAGEFVKTIKADKVNYEDFGGDTGADGALMLNQMSRIAQTHSFHGISSIGDAHNKDKYKNRVTELWFQARDVFRTGICRGVDLKSKAVIQLCSRRYESFGKKFYQIEKKKDMKKRTGRSPDDADALIYAVAMVILSGVISDEIDKARAILDADEIREERQQDRDAYLGSSGPQLTEDDEDDFDDDDDEGDLEDFDNDNVDYHSCF